MPTRMSSAVWEGDLKSGKGTMKLGSGAYEGSYSFLSRFESGAGTNPEELIAAASAGCFSMAFANRLASNGFVAKSVKTTANATLEKVGDAFKISRVELSTEAVVPGIDPKVFMEHAEFAKANCPVSKALAGTEIKLQAKLVG